MIESIEPVIVAIPSTTLAGLGSPVINGLINMLKYPMHIVMVNIMAIAAAVFFIFINTKKCFIVKMSG